MMPSAAQILDVINAINAQHPSLSDDAAQGWNAAGSTVQNEQAYGRRIVRLTAEQVATIAGALGAAMGVARADAAWATTSPAQVAWAGIIDVALAARGAPPGEMRSEAFGALTRVDVATLERMAALVLGGPQRHAPDPNVCWHCKVCLVPAARHCESCPPEGECDVEGCEQEGCAQ